MKFKKKIKNEYILQLVTFGFLTFVAGGMITIGIIKNDWSFLVMGITVFGISALIPLLGTAALILTAMRANRKRLLREIRKTIPVDKTITNERK